MFLAAILLCPDFWRLVRRFVGKSINGVVFATLAFPLFFTGFYVSVSSQIPGALPKDLEKVSEYFKSLIENGSMEADKAKAPGPMVDQGGVNFFRHVMEQDYLIGLSGGKSALAELSMINPVDRLPSYRLARLYRESEGAADEFYKGKKIIVSGEIQAVRINFTEEVVIELPGSGPFSNVQAVLDHDSGKYTGSLMEGENVGLYCTVHGRIINNRASHIYLKDCTSVDFSEEAKEYSGRLAGKLDAWLHAGGTHTFPSEFAASYFLATYLTGTRLPSDNPCRNGQAALERCISSLEAFDTRNLFEMSKGDLDRWRKWLALPPQASHVSSR